MNVWLVSREYAGIAEAGGVKNVACSLAESLARLGHTVTLFIPLYGCTDLSSVEAFCCFWRNPVTVCIQGKRQVVSFARGMLSGVEIVFVCHKSFAEKKAVYTYTKEEQAANPLHRQGEGHEDTVFLNILFQKSVVRYAVSCHNGESPDIVHCQDAPAALLPAFLQHERELSPQMSRFFSGTKCVVTIHNAGPGYHHAFKDMAEAESFTDLPKSMLSDGQNGTCVEPFLISARYACMTTVSPEYAREILSGKTDTAGLSQQFRRLGVKIIGITNGIDFSKYEPSDTSRSLLPFSFDPGKRELAGKYECRNLFLEKYASSESIQEKGIVQFGHISTEADPDSFAYIAYHGRVVQQKGIEVMVKACGLLLEKGLAVRFIFAGQGSVKQEQLLADFAVRHSGSCVYLKGYSRLLARLSVASADFSLHPSWFEPCGLEDFIAQTFGTLPVAHATGGLCKIVDDETGYLYAPNTPEELSSVLESLVQLQRRAGRGIFTGMISYAARYIRETYSWDRVALDYESLYRQLKFGREPCFSS